MSARKMPELTPEDRTRYARHLVLPEIEEEGQRKLKAARALLVGAGGLGSAIALYLVSAGIGRLGIVDDDRVDLSNLQRQILHGTARLGVPKPTSAHERLSDLNPGTEIIEYAERFDTSSAERLAEDYDLILDGTDNFLTRYAINETCLALGVPYVYGAVFRFDGQASLLCAENGPCYRCLFPEPPPSGRVMTNAQAGILGAVPGTIGTIQAAEAVKWILGIGRPLIGRLLVYDAAAMHFEEISIEKNPRCPSCGRSGHV